MYELVSQVETDSDAEIWAAFNDNSSLETTRPSERQLTEVACDATRRGAFNFKRHPRNMNHHGIIPVGREIARTSRRDSRLRSAERGEGIAAARVRLNIMSRPRATLIPH